MQVRGGLMELEEAVVFRKELGLKDAQTIEFGKQIGGGVGDRAERIGRVGGLPLPESAMGFVELAVIHLGVAVLEAGRLSQAGCGATQDHGRQQHENLHKTISKLSKCGIGLGCSRLRYMGTGPGRKRFRRGDCADNAYYVKSLTAPIRSCDCAGGTVFSTARSGCGPCTRFIIRMNA